MDKDLDDLLDSALGDFAKKAEPIKINDQTNKKSQNVTIEKTNLYVDDIDYDDRPARTPATKFVGGISSSSSNVNKLLNTATLGANKATSNSKSSSILTEDSNESDFNFSDENMKMFDQIFNDEKAKESMKQFKDMLNMFKNEEDEGKMMENFEKVMSQLTTEDLNDDDDDEEKSDEFLKNLTSMANKTKPSTSQDKDSETQEKKDPFAKVLDDINKNSEKVFKNNKSSGFPFGADFLASLNNPTNSEDDDNLDGASSLMMEPILNMLFSKEILYPSLKLMLENYDSYINERREKMTEDELKKCLDQKECIKQMCSIYDAQQESDSSEKRSENLKKILDLLEKCGMPPSELVPEVNPFEALGDQVKGTGCPIS
jgi:hypothetical protein